MVKAGILYDKRYSNLLGIGGCPEDEPNYINTITANTNPDLDKWGPDCMWEGKHWVRWHQVNVAANGKQKADEKFAFEWQKRSAFGHELWIANNDVEFRTYAIAQGLNKTVPDLKMIEVTGKIPETITNVGVSALDVVSNLAKAGENTTEAVSTIASWLPWIVLAGMVLVGYLMFTKKSVNVL